MLFWITDQQFSMPQGNLIIITDLLTKAHTHMLNLIDRALQRCKLWEETIQQKWRNSGDKNKVSQVLRAGQKVGREKMWRGCRKAELEAGNSQILWSLRHYSHWVSHFRSHHTQNHDSGVWRRALLGCGRWGLERQAPPQARIPPVSEGTGWG